MEGARLRQPKSSGKTLNVTPADTMRFDKTNKLRKKPTARPRSMDADNNGALDFNEMLQALKELGALDGLPVSSMPAQALHSF